MENTLPVLRATGRGSDVKFPMAIPTFGGMVLAVMTIFFVPALYCGMAERSLRRQGLPAGRPEEPGDPSPS